jgi:hypothetical protein
MNIIVLSFLTWTTSGAEPPPPAPSAAPQDAGPARPAGEGLQGLERQIEDLRKKLDSESAARAEERKAWEERIKKLEEEIERQKLQAAAREESDQAAHEEKPQGFLGSLASALNPSLALVGNAFARVDDRKVTNRDGDRIDDQVNLREAELDARAAVDPYADAVLILSFESEFPGDATASVEEGFVTIKRLPFLEEPPLGLKLRAGRFRPAFGKINVLHTHDLPQSIRPLVAQEFLGDDGFIANGGSAELFIPTPWDKESSLDLTLQAMNAGGMLAAEDARNDFAYLAHLRWFKTFAEVHSVDFGTSGYYGPTENQGNDAIYLGGLDLFYKWKPLRQGEWHSILIGGEVFAANREFLQTPAGGGAAREARTSPFGYYVMAQYQFGPRLYGGARWDWTETIDDDRVERSAIVPYVSYYLSEFLRFRINYQHMFSDIASEDGLDTVFLELNFIIGAHPPEPFWVNK